MLAIIHISSSTRSLRLSLGPHSDVGASSVADHPMNPSPLDSLELAAMSDNKRGLWRQCFLCIQNVTSMSAEEFLWCFHGVCFFFCSCEKIIELRVRFH